MGIKLDLLTDVDMLLMELEQEYAMQSNNMQNAVINTWMILIKIKNPHLLIIRMWIICMGGK